jgi:putative acetyltransferase
MQELIGDRIILRNFSESDLNDFYEYCKDENIGPNAGWEPHKSIEDSKVILDKFVSSDDVWAIALKDSNKVIGSIGLHPDRKRLNVNAKMIGYVLSGAYHHKGYMSEAVKLVMNYAFNDLKIDLMAVYHYPHNLASKRVIERAGFKYEGTLRNASKIFNGTILDDVCYSITKEEYFRIGK